MAMLGGPSATCDEVALSTRPELKKLKGGWIVGGYLSNWIKGDLPGPLASGFRVVQDLLPTNLSESADVVLPSAAWAEKDGCWENYAGMIQPFIAAVPPPEGVTPRWRALSLSAGPHGLIQCRRDSAGNGRAVRFGRAADRIAQAPAMEFAEL